MPIDVPQLPFLEMAAFQKPATEVGGDYYDFFLMESDELLLAIGDATGHDVGASLMVLPTKTALMAIEEPDLMSRVSKINTLLKHVNTNRLLNMGLALFEISHDANSQTVHIKAAGGGMPSCYILRADGSVEEIVIVGMPLGVMEAAKYTPACNTPAPL